MLEGKRACQGICRAASELTLIKHRRHFWRQIDVHGQARSADHAKHMVAMIGQIGLPAMGVRSHGHGCSRKLCFAIA